jgi:hypothetical protein
MASEAPRAEKEPEESKANNNQHGSSKEEPVSLLGCLVWIGAAIVVAVASVPTLREFLAEWWWAVLIAVASLATIPALIFWLIPRSRAWFRAAAPRKRAFLAIFAGSVLLLFVLAAVGLLPSAWQAPVFRGIFVLVACLLPGAMYYLFILTKRESLLNEYVLNLRRLGVLTPQQPRQVESYLERFEATYGPLSDKSRLAEQLVRESSSTAAPLADRFTLTNVFTANVVIPLGTTTILVALGWNLVLPLWQGRNALSLVGLTSRRSQTAVGEAQAERGEAGAGVAAQLQSALIPALTPVNFAFLGAYLFSLQMIFRRYVRQDLGASAYVQFSLRIVFAVIGTWVFVEADRIAAGDNVQAAYTNAAHPGGRLLVAGFIIGMFPRVVWQFLSAMGRKLFGWGLPSLEARLPLSDLDGLTVFHETRFEEEGIENIPNMATADVVDLMLNTRFPPNRIIDWVDQAILYTQLGPATDAEPSQRAKLRQQGIRTATGLLEAYRRSKGRYKDQDNFEKILAYANGVRSPIRALADTLETDPNLKLVKVWKGLR